MHAFIIASRSINNLQFTISKIATEQKAKQITFTLQKIEDARELKKITKFSFNQKTAIVINDIDKSSEEALNAFLKNLEEPNENLIYILTASNLSSVLPTIVSRCQVIKTLNPKSEILNKSQIAKFLNSKLNQKFEMVGKIKEREDAIKFVENLILASNVKVRPSHMENYLKTLKNLKLNGNVSLQLTNLIARMESQK